MKENPGSLQFNQHDLAILRHSTPIKLLITCLLSCMIGIIFTAVTSQYFLMAVFLLIMASAAISAFLLYAQKISLTAACLVPLLLLCYVYTPLSWFAYNGLMGSTPFLSILFITMITLISYRKVQAVLLSIYGVLLALLILHWLRTTAYDVDMIQLVSLLIAYGLTVAVVVFTINAVKRKNIEVNEQITNLSMHDEMTNLLNRRAVEQVFALQESTPNYAVIMMDVDKFKSINDQFGHDIGDSILKSIAAAIDANIRTGDRAFRLGGDEFLILLPQVSQAVVAQITSRIETSVQEIQGSAISVSVSTGTAFRWECSNTKELLALADQRMYQNKRSKTA
ncbi:MAG TPA: GGDEF domain-containing protein [Candidatus Limiplasma sp.]|nr:GGDEF domain-containing protein [Candidatus Limiplasma sp.]